MLNTNQKNQLSNKLRDIFPQVTYSESDRQVRIGNRSFKVPTKPNTTLFTRQNLTR